MNKVNHLLKRSSLLASKLSVSTLSIFAALGLSPMANAELVGVSPEVPLINFSGTGTTEFNSGLGQFKVNSAPIALVLPPVKFINNTTIGTKSFKINIEDLKYIWM